MSKVAQQEDRFILKKSDGSYRAIRKPVTDRDFESIIKKVSVREEGGFGIILINDEPRGCGLEMSADIDEIVDQLSSAIIERMVRKDDEERGRVEKDRITTC